MRQDNSLTMLFLRVYLWLVPIVMLVASVVFGGIAAADGRWGLVGMMAVLGMAGLGLAVLHYWMLYRFGKGAGQ